MQQSVLLCSAPSGRTSENGGRHWRRALRAVSTILDSGNRAPLPSATDRNTNALTRRMRRRLHQDDGACGRCALPADHVTREPLL